ncbi:tRNA (adenosine(37)-N6)-threonylcarbamoyltransferase complex ATPase subunit type 1 TsaE [Candidatus Vallotiella sp. (ex Adelges kitamiensis)]|uniref:tRNA (adenosine(37)-N6)-threonylcarbamoyltransferase complex ATPase subunit type 1 TsaE n=1 Tax=Candidatus Vallotiella sp. (ex Adelges kitamiensis) TaxID=2864217 RepID=UPI002A4E1BA1|nr:tRNA (adenosine(37)-N6)-threonylcarbamoyltransferase complex ATPase subunit type 1 TsaE [Candidatus Vallotia sp. (ex Adelges kitamiensis)]
MRHIKVLPCILMERVFVLADERATHTFGSKLAIALITAMRAVTTHGIQVHLSGDLGSGKTTLVRAILWALGYTQYVRSPTYTLVEPYIIGNVDGVPLLVYHFDLYRFVYPSEWEDMGFREYYDTQALHLIEWPERASGMLGLPDLQFVLEVQGESRKLTARAYSETGKACLAPC